MFSVIFNPRLLVLPACAGVILMYNANDSKGFSFTRMRGGDPLLRVSSAKNKEFYPHARG